jgi:hypothetical protein
MRAYGATDTAQVAALVKLEVNLINEADYAGLYRAIVPSQRRMCPFAIFRDHWRQQVVELKKRNLRLSIRQVKVRIHGRRAEASYVQYVGAKFPPRRIGWGVDWYVKVAGRWYDEIENPAFCKR